MGAAFGFSMPHLSYKIVPSCHCRIVFELAKNDRNMLFYLMDRTAITVPMDYHNLSSGVRKTEDIRWLKVNKLLSNSVDIFIFQAIL